jgi:hypothetical protein
MIFDWENDELIPTIMQHCTALCGFRAPGSGWNVSEASICALTKRLPEMQHLCLLHCDFASDDPVLAIAQCCGNLRSLELLRLEKDVSQNALITLVSNLHSIVELNLSHCKLSDSLLTAIAVHCPDLKSLHIYDSYGHTDAGIIALAKGCAALELVFTRSDTNVPGPATRAQCMDLRPDLRFADVEGRCYLWLSLENIEREEFEVW